MIFRKLTTLSLLFFASIFASAQTSPCTSQHEFRVNNAWDQSQTIPYGYVLGFFNPSGSGCDVYVTGITMSAGTNVPYFVFGAAFSNAAMPGCTNNVQITDLAFPFAISALPGGIQSSDLPCGTYVTIGTVPDGRWTLASGVPYEDAFDKPRLITPGHGYSIWTSPAGYPTVKSAVGDLAVTINVVTVTQGVAPVF